MTSIDTTRIWTSYNRAYQYNNGDTSKPSTPNIIDEEELFEILSESRDVYNKIATEIDKNTITTADGKNINWANVDPDVILALYEYRNSINSFNPDFQSIDKILEPTINQNDKDISQFLYLSFFNKYFSVGTWIQQYEEAGNTIPAGKEDLQKTKVGSLGEAINTRLGITSYANILNNKYSEIFGGESGTLLTNKITLFEDMNNIIRESENALNNNNVDLRTLSDLLMRTVPRPGVLTIIDAYYKLGLNLSGNNFILGQIEIPDEYKIDSLNSVGSQPGIAFRLKSKIEDIIENKINNITDISEVGASVSDLYNLYTLSEVYGQIANNNSRDNLFFISPSYINALAQKINDFAAQEITAAEDALDSGDTVSAYAHYKNAFDNLDINRLVSTISNRDGTHIVNEITESLTANTAENRRVATNALAAMDARVAEIYNRVSSENISASNKINFLNNEQTDISGVYLPQDYLPLLANHRGVTSKNILQNILDSIKSIGDLAAVTRSQLYQTEATEIDPETQKLSNDAINFQQQFVNNIWEIFQNISARTIDDSRPHLTALATQVSRLGKRNLIPGEDATSIVRFIAFITLSGRKANSPEPFNQVEKIEITSATGKSVAVAAGQSEVDIPIEATDISQFATSGTTLTDTNGKYLNAQNVLLTGEYGQITLADYLANNSATQFSSNDTPVAFLYDGKTYLYDSQTGEIRGEAGFSIVKGDDGKYHAVFPNGDMVIQDATVPNPDYDLSNPDPDDPNNPAYITVDINVTNVAGIDVSLYLPKISFDGSKINFNDFNPDDENEPNVGIYIKDSQNNRVYIELTDEEKQAGTIDISRIDNDTFFALTQGGSVFGIQVGDSFMEKDAAELFGENYVPAEDPFAYKVIIKPGRNQDMMPNLDITEVGVEEGTIYLKDNEGKITHSARPPMYTIETIDGDGYFDADSGTGWGDITVYATRYIEKEDGTTEKVLIPQFIPLPVLPEWMLNHQDDIPHSLAMDKSRQPYVKGVLTKEFFTDAQTDYFSFLKDVMGRNGLDIVYTETANGKTKKYRSSISVTGQVAQKAFNIIKERQGGFGEEDLELLVALMDCLEGGKSRNITDEAAYASALTRVGNIEIQAISVFQSNSQEMADRGYISLGIELGADIEGTLVDTNEIITTPYIQGFVKLVTPGGRHVVEISAKESIPISNIDGYYQNNLEVAAKYTFALNPYVDLFLSGKSKSIFAEKNTFGISGLGGANIHIPLPGSIGGHEQTLHITPFTGIDHIEYNNNSASLTAMPIGLNLLYQVDGFSLWGNSLIATIPLAGEGGYKELPDARIFPKIEVGASYNIPLVGDFSLPLTLTYNYADNYTNNITDMRSHIFGVSAGLQIQDTLDSALSFKINPFTQDKILGANVNILNFNRFYGGVSTQFTLNNGIKDYAVGLNFGIKFYKYPWEK